MSTHVNPSEKPYPSKTKGEAMKPQQGCTHKLDDFSQRAINHGQRKINYELTVVDKKLAGVLEMLVKTLKEKLAAVPGFAQDDLDAVEGAITEFYEASKKVAGIIPPGCDPPGDGPGSEP